MPTEKLKTITAMDLAAKELPPIQFIVEDLLPQGLHILAGAPKTGKSWLLLFLCLKVAKGEEFWNKKTKQGTVLYLCLEDSEVRLQTRLDELTQEPPEDLFFATMVNSLAEGLLEQIRRFLEEQKDTTLVIIDTLQKVRGGINDANLYANDYKDIGQLKAITDEYGIAMIVVQHLRKQFDSDPHSMVTGSTGLLGAADGSYVLKREDNSEGMAKFYMKGRDIEEQILSIRFSKETMSWDFISSNTPSQESLQKDSTIISLIDFLKTKHEFLGTAGELAEQLKAFGNIKINPNVLSRKLKKFTNQLLEQGISYTKKRSGARREVLLVFVAHDDNDANTDILGSAEVLSQE